MLLEAAISHKRQKVSHRTSNGAFSAFLTEPIGISQRQEVARIVDGRCATNRRKTMSVPTYVINLMEVFAFLAHCWFIHTSSARISPRMQTRKIGDHLARPIRAPLNPNII